MLVEEQNCEPKFQTLFEFWRRERQENIKIFEKCKDGSNNCNHVSDDDYDDNNNN
jgi:hypothetical protein